MIVNTHFPGGGAGGVRQLNPEAMILSNSSLPLYAALCSAVPCLAVAASHLAQASKKAPQRHGADGCDEH